MSILNFVCLSDHPGASFSMNVDEKKLMKINHAVYGECRVTKCPTCGGQAKHIGYRTAGVFLTWEMDKSMGERREHGKDMIQRYRDGELSREFVETYPKQVKGMIEKGVVTKKQVRESKEVWKNDIKGISNLPYSGIASQLGKE